MQEPGSELYQVQKKDVKKVIETFVAAFFNDRLLCYFVPEPEKRLRFLPRYFNYRVRNGLIAGSIYATSEDMEGAMILTQSEYKKEYSWSQAMRTGGMALYRVAGSELVRRMRDVESYVFSKRFEYLTKPFLYLGSLAVHPDHQGKGLASKLIRPVLERCSTLNRLCVLDTQSERLVQMYQHYGFEVIASYTLPEANIPHWIMAKDP